ncbi:hypothetical protein LguiA_026206 [Lonicera macranthoides]
MKRRRGKTRKMNRIQVEEMEEYVYMVFRQHLCRVNLSQLSECPECPPALETVLFFPEKDLPVGMGSFCLESKLYLLGGEKLKGSETLVSGQDFSPPNLLHSLNRDVFELDPNLGIACVSQEIPPMVGPKTGAKAVTVDGKIYVFSTTQYCYKQVVPKPRFECYDPSRNEWKELPNPPFYVEEWPLSYLYLSVLGRRIFVTSSQWYHYYDVDENEWKYAVEYLNLEPDPFDFWGSIAEGCGIIVAYTVKGLLAYTDASLTCGQPILTHLTSRFPPADPNSETSFIRYLGGGRFCFVLVDDSIIFVTAFVVLREADFVASHVISYFTYDGRLVYGSDEFPPTDVFIMKERRRSGGGDFLTL